MSIRWNIENPSKLGAKRLIISAPAKDEVSDFIAFMSKASRKFARINGSF